jgi:hypothetical protein
MRVVGDVRWGSINNSDGHDELGETLRDKFNSCIECELFFWAV